MDMKTRLEDINLYEFWNSKISNYFSDNELIINLASNEFSRLLNKDKNIINIEFKEFREDGKLRTVAARAKILRGLMVKYFVIKKINNIEEINFFFELGYNYNSKLSNTKKYFFTK